MDNVARQKPNIAFFQIFNMALGFFGLQIGFALQNANASRIAQSLGADYDKLALFWLAGPVTGLILQPIVGYMSDRTWGRLGRRRPFFLIGALRMGLLGAENIAASGAVAPSVKWAFAAGAALLILSVLWTVLSSKEYSPEELAEFEAADTSDMAVSRKAPRPVPDPGFFTLWGTVSLAISITLTAFVFGFNTEKQFIIFAALVGVFGSLFLYNASRLKAGREPGFIGTLMDDFATMPMIMRRLAFVQFTSWFAFFILWVYLTPAVTSHHFGSSDTASQAYGNGALAVNDIFALYGIVSMFFALAIPVFTKFMGVKPFYALSLLIGGASFAGLYFMRPEMFWINATGIGIVWACVLTLPYVLLADALPPSRMGTYMGIFNFFIVIPQLVVGTVMGAVLSTFLENEPVRTLVLAGVIMASGAVLLLFVPHKDARKA